MLTDTRDGAARRVVTWKVVSDTGSVTDALSDFVDDALAQAAVAAGCDERTMRDWVEHSLVDPSGHRLQVVHAPSDIGPEALRALEDARLVRSSTRGEVTFHELTHDRLVVPLARANERWRAAHLAPWQQDADIWHRRGRPDDLVMSGPLLTEARRRAAEASIVLSPVDDDFLAASSRRELDRLADERAARRGRMLVGAVAVVAALVGVGACTAVNEARIADRLGIELGVARAAAADASSDLDTTRRELRDVGDAQAAAVEAIDEADLARRSAADRTDEADLAREAATRDLVEAEGLLELRVAERDEADLVLATAERELELEQVELASAREALQRTRSQQRSAQRELREAQADLSAAEQELRCLEETLTELEGEEEQALQRYEPELQRLLDTATALVELRAGLETLREEIAWEIDDDPCP